LLIVALALLAWPCAAQTVVDGDTLKLGGVSYRLWGIDAPEARQMCGRWRAGFEASQHLRGLIAGRRVACETRTTDRYGRSVAICRADRADLSAAMVQAGMAWAFVKYSRDYVDQEGLARADRLGVHAWGCEVPWEWRRR
jgi:endonuclease YncB( thermonuclease family)